LISNSEPAGISSAAALSNAVLNDARRKNCPIFRLT